MPTKSTNAISQPAKYESATGCTFGRTADVKSRGSNIPMTTATTQQSESLSVRVTTRPVKLDVNTR